MKKKEIIIIISIIIVVTVITVIGIPKVNMMKFSGPIQLPNRTFNTNDVEIQNIQLHPATIKVGDTFTVSATLINNSKNPIYVEINTCGPPFFIIFDSHVTVDVKQILCEQMLMIQKVNVGEKIIRTGPDALTTFRATESGITNATVTLYYEEENQNIKKTISKSFYFTILDK